jgi:cyclic pyranopterin phosphate synthase
MEVLKLGDRFGRVATDLRVSLTDKCNLRCTYCMPAEGLDWMPDEKQLTDDELVRLIRVGVERLGIEEIRFTGGEPLVRRGIVDIIGRVRDIDPHVDLSMTTNALGLARSAQALADAGLNRVNVSLDTVRADTFKTITRRDRVDDVIAGLAAAEAAGLGPVKVNAVLMRGVNDDQAPELLRWCLDRGYELRFIEQMPLDAQHGWQRDGMITADGQVRNCLFARDESDLRLALRGGATDEEIAQRWVTAMVGKLPGHGIDDAGFLQPDRPMSAIGG